jgi:hypothetical protein
MVTTKPTTPPTTARPAPILNNIESHISPPASVLLQSRHDVGHAIGRIDAPIRTSAELHVVVMLYSVGHCSHGHDSLQQIVGCRGRGSLAAELKSTGDGA